MAQRKNKFSEENFMAGFSVGLAAGAAGMFLFAVVTAFMALQFTKDQLLTIPQQIAEEVVNNHLNLKPLEVKTGSINAVRGYFTKLDFMPVESSLQALNDLQLIGGDIAHCRESPQPNYG